VARRVLVLTLALAVPAVLLTGCGNSRTPVPSLTHPAAPDGFRKLVYPGLDIQFEVPRDWTVSAQRAPLIATVTSGPATVALWRYVRPRPSSAESLDVELKAARASLVASAQAHAERLQVIRARIVRLGGVPAVILDATERIAGAPRRVRSIHLFGTGVELVVEEYAPPAIFHTVDHQVFSPLKRSLALLWAPAA
jgi:hypothetical protein